MNDYWLNPNLIYFMAATTFARNMTVLIILVQHEANK